MTQSALVTDAPSALIDSETAEPGGPVVVSSAGEKLVASAVDAVGLTRVYPGNPPVEALRGVSFRIARGESVALLGKSGSGKSTLMNLLGGLDRPTSGQLHVAGRELGVLSARQMAEYRLTGVGMVFQSFNLVPTLTARENVELPLVFAARSPSDRHAATVAALEAVGMGHRMDHRPTQLSGGEQQRVAIARALINDPPILLADEPTGNLDSANAEAVLGLLLERVRSRGVTLILVTHDEDLARRAASRVIRMRDGQVVSDIPASAGV